MEGHDFGQDNWVTCQEFSQNSDNEIVIHIVPINDYESHKISMACWCQPYLDYKCKENGDEFVQHRFWKEMIRVQPQ